MRDLRFNAERAGLRDVRAEQAAAEAFLRKAERRRISCCSIRRAPAWARPVVERLCDHRSPALDHRGLRPGDAGARSGRPAGGRVPHREDDAGGSVPADVPSGDGGAVVLLIPMNPSEPFLSRAARWLTFASAACILFSIAASQILLALALVALLLSGATAAAPHQIAAGAVPARHFDRLGILREPAAGLPQIRKIYVFCELLVVFSAMRDMRSSAGCFSPGRVSAASPQAGAWFSLPEGATGPALARAIAIPFTSASASPAS